MLRPLPELTPVDRRLEAELKYTFSMANPRVWHQP